MSLENNENGKYLDVTQSQKSSSSGQSQVALEDIVLLTSILKEEAVAIGVMSNIVFHMDLMAAMNGYTPAGRF